MKRFTILGTAALASLSVVQAEPVYPKLVNVEVVECDATLGVQDICRLKQDPPMADALAHLGSKDVAFWRDGDRFTVVAKRKADSISLCCAIDAPMARWPDSDLWTLTVKSPHFDAAVVDITVAGGDSPSPAPATSPDDSDIAKAEAFFNARRPRTPELEWRGPKAPPAPDYYEGALHGALHLQDIKSTNLNETRRIAVYLPPEYKKGGSYPVVYMADGKALLDEARIIEPLIVAGKIRPVIAVGLYAGQGRQRAADYLIGSGGGEKFLAHEAFLLKEVMPTVESEYSISRNPKERMIYGFSHGASWSIDIALRNPQQFGRAAVLSLSSNGMRGVAWNPGRQKLHLSAGLFEPTFLKLTRAHAQAARQAGVNTTFVTRVSGHTSVAWDLSLVDTLVWAFGKK